MRFCWHPAAQIIDAAGQSHGPLPRPMGGILPDRPAAQALRQALGSDTFRIGAYEAPAPECGPRPVFETLSGGSTGQPRRIRRSQQSWIASFAVNDRLFGLGRPAAVLGRLVHSLALYGAVETLHLGGTLHLLEGLRPDRQRIALADRRVAVVYATPAQLRQLIATPGPDLPDLDLILVGGSKLDPGLRQGLAAVSAARIIEFYGAAETSFIAMADDDTPSQSCGRPYPGVTLCPRPDGISIHSPYLAEGYAGPPGGAIWRDGGLWLDEFVTLDQGFVTPLGRASRMVKVADQPVYPETIETLMLSLPGVAQAAALPRPDPRRGHVIEAAVMGDPSQARAILRSLRQALGPLMAPRRLHWRADWPMLPSGKPDLAALTRDLDDPPAAAMAARP